MTTGGPEGFPCFRSSHIERGRPEGVVWQGQSATAGFALTSLDNHGEPGVPFAAPADITAAITAGYTALLGNAPKGLPVHVAERPGAAQERQRRRRAWTGCTVQALRRALSRAVFRDPRFPYLPSRLGPFTLSVCAQTAFMTVSTGAKSLDSIQTLISPGPVGRMTASAWPR